MDELTSDWDTVTGHIKPTSRVRGARCGETDTALLGCLMVRLPRGSG